MMMDLEVMILVMFLVILVMFLVLKASLVMRECRW